jgi:hypothetical protein
MGLTAQKMNVGLQNEMALEFAMKEIVDRVLDNYGLTHELDTEQVMASRDRIIRYIDMLVSAGQNDPHQLIIYASAHLNELHEGRDPRFTGC